MRNKNYLVGFEGEGQVVYGKDCKVGLTLDIGSPQWAEPMTLLQAKRYVKRENSRYWKGRKNMVIYKLVKV